MEKLYAMKIFVTVAETGGFSKASRSLDIPLSTVSRQVSDLESHLGVRLFNRSTRKVELSEVGATYFDECRTILSRVEDAERCVKDEYTALKGALSITAPLVFGRVYLLPVITQFLGLNPEINIRLILTDQPVDLLDEHIDLALRIGDLADTSIKAISLGKVRHVVCASPAYIEKYGQPKHPKELGQHSCITTHGAQPAPWTFVQGAKKYVVSINARLCVTTVEASIDASLMGIGIARVLSYQIHTHVAQLKLVTLLKSFEPAPIPIRFLYLAGQSLPLKVRTFLDFATAALRAHDFC